MKWTKIKKGVYASEVDEPCFLKTKSGMRRAEKGNWLIKKIRKVKNGGRGYREVTTIEITRTSPFVTKA